MTPPPSISEPTRAPAPRPAAPASPPSAPARLRPEQYIQRILQSEDFPAFSRQMGELMASLQEGEASAQRLANLVLRDYALTVKVIRTANTVHYNRTGRPVQSATQAMMLLGARTVRDLAGELLLFEHYRKRSPGLKELMLLSLLTAGHSREAAARLGLGDPEAAQLAGMFRNLGEVLVAAHLPQEYATVLRITAKDSGREPRKARDAAAVLTLGMSFEDVGVAIAGDWGMPEHVCRGMRATGQGGEDALELVTAFGHDLTSAIHRAEPAQARQGIAAVLELYGKRLQLSREVLASIADAAVIATRETFAAAGVVLDDLRLGRQISAALHDRDPATRRPGGPGERPANAAAGEAAAGGAGAAPAAGAAGATPEGMTGEHPVAPLPCEVADGAAPAGAGDGTTPPTSGPALSALRDRLSLEVEAAAGDPAQHDLHSVLLIALEAGLRGGPFDRVSFCAPDPRVTELRPRLALGDGAETLSTRLRIPVTPPGSAVGAALLRGEEVFLGCGGRVGPAEAALLRPAGASCVGMLPLIVDGIAIGCLYFDRVDRPGRAPMIEASTLAYVRRLTATVTRAVALRRPGSQPQTPPPPQPSLQPSLQPPPMIQPQPRHEPTPMVSMETVAPAPAAGAPAPAEAPAAVSALQSVEAKASAVLRLLRGESAARLSEELSVPVAQLEAWQREFLAGAIARLAAS